LREQVIDGRIMLKFNLEKFYVKECTELKRFKIVSKNRIL